MAGAHFRAFVRPGPRPAQKAASLGVGKHGEHMARAAGDSGHSARSAREPGERVGAYQRRLADSRLQRIGDERIVLAFAGMSARRPRGIRRCATELSGDSPPGCLLLVGGMCTNVRLTSEPTPQVRHDEDPLTWRELLVGSGSLVAR